jgi:lipopolysaccharide transport system ATP-binding protein
LALPGGSSTAIIGANGAGKSTLLKVLTGTLEATKGSARVVGRMASLLELGTGFHPLFTGRQNIFFNARFLGLSDEEIHARLPEIEAFSELDAFLDRPLRTYSSGMQVRLAFAVAASVRPDVLIVDEVLAVGDMYFQQKCMQRIRKFRDDGVTILFVSHDPGAVKTLCDRAVLLHAGCIVDDGKPTDVLEHYNGMIARKTVDLAPRADGPRRSRPRRSGTFEALVADIDLVDGEGRPVRTVLAGSLVTIRVRVCFFDAVVQPTIGILIRDRLGNDVYGTNTYHQGIDTGLWSPGDAMEVRFAMRLDLGDGEYAVTAAVHSLGVHVFHSYDWLESGLAFQVLPPDERRSIGVARLSPTISVTATAFREPATNLLGRALGPLPHGLSMEDDRSDVLCTGWYAVEGAGADAFRWTDGVSTFVLDVSGDTIGFDMAVDRPAASEPVRLRLSSLGREIGVAAVRAGTGYQVVRLPVADRLPQGPAHFRLEIHPTWRPPGDERTLGVRVRRIWCETAPSER